jgi:hypothetical protein
MNGVRIVTVCTRSRLADAAVLADSLEAFHPGVPRLLFLAERDIQPGDPGCGWQVRPAASLSMTDPDRFLFQYPPFELCCSLKPFALEAALNGPGVTGAVYLDGDMLVLAPFLDAVEAAWRDADVWLTPHLATVSPAPAMSNLLHTGSYNAGFLAVRAAPDGRQFLKWLQARMARDCVQDFASGLFVDQKWLDLAAAVCPGVRSLHHPGLNTGHWNLHEQTFEARGNDVLIDGARPLMLFHFSGLTKAALSRHGAGSEAPPAIALLAARYRQAIAEQRKRWRADAPYTGGCFSDGMPILPAHREAVRLGLVSATDPFAARAEVEKTAAGLTAPARSFAEAVEADARLRRIRAHPVIGRIWRFWKRWVNHDLP